MFRRQTLLCVLPPFGAALWAQALIDLGGYSAFVRSLGDGSSYPPDWATAGTRASAPAAVLAIGLLMFLASLFSRSSAVRGGGWLALALGLAAPVALALAAQARMTPSLTVIACGDAPRSSRHLIEYVGLGMTGGGLLVASFAAAIRARTGEWMLGAVAGAALLGIALVQHHALGELRWPHSVPVVNASLDAVRTIHLWATLAAWLVAGALTAWRLRRVLPIRTRGAVVGCVIGLAAFAATRTRGHDARAVLPLLEDWAYIDNDAQVPSLARCESDQWPAYQLTLQRWGPVFDDKHLSPPVFEKLRARIEKREEMLDFIAERNPGFHRVTLALRIQARPEMAMTDLMPYLVVAAEFGITKIQVEALRTIAFDAWTYPDQERHPLCVQTFTLDPAAPPLSRLKTWADVARAVEAGDRRAALR